MKIRWVLLLAVLLPVLSCGATGADAEKKALVLAKGEQCVFFMSLCKSKAPWLKFTQAMLPDENEPNLTEDGLAGFDLIILGELAPGEGRTGSSLVTAAQQEAIRKRVEDGANFFMFGGWSSFQGGNDSWCGRWHGTPIAEIVPVVISPTWDNCDDPMKIVLDIPDHPIVAGLKWATVPPLGGHNKVDLKEGATLVAHTKEDGRPLIVTGEYGRGKTLVYTSTYGGWDKDIYMWSGYKQFWFQMLTYIAQQ